MKTLSREAAPQLSNRELVQITAEAAIAHVTREFLKKEYRLWLDAVHPDDVTLQYFRRKFIDATGNRCAYMSSFTGNFLQTYPDRFSDMLLVRSRTTKDTPAGRAEWKRWSHDTWLLLLCADGTYIATCPAKHDNSSARPTVDVFESGTLEGALAHIKRERENWEWPDANEVQEFMATHDTSPTSFCTDYDSARGICTYTTVAKVKHGQSLKIDDNRLSIQLSIYDAKYDRPEPKTALDYI